MKLCGAWDAGVGGGGLWGGWEGGWLCRVGGRGVVCGVGGREMVVWGGWEGGLYG